MEQPNLAAASAAPEGAAKQRSRALVATDQEQSRACCRARDGGQRRAHPVARIAHRGKLPALELLGRLVADRKQPRANAADEMLGRIDRRERAPQKSLEVAHAPSSSASATISSSCRIARWIRTFVAPSLRPRARAISRLSIPSAKRMISA